MTSVDIRNAAAQKLSTGFPDYNLYHDILPQDFSRPCFLVRITSVSKTNQNVYQYEKAVAADIGYYPGEAAGTGVLEMQEQLEGVFDLELQAGDRVLGIDKTKGEILEDVLHFTFELSFTESRNDPEESLESMQTLEMKEEF